MKAKTELSQRAIVPTTRRTPPVPPDALEGLLDQLPDWSVVDGRLGKQFTFDDFAGAMKFVNAMAKVAEKEGHHPDFTVHYNEVTVVLWTHVIGGLSENDFVLAAKIDALRR
jgi:4a-hydroxytetrahydrobiopterin dehydratase